MKKYKVFWTREAVSDLEELIQYILADKISAAITTYKEIKTKCNLLSGSPAKYRVVPELQDIGITNYREIINKPYRIIFKLTNLEVFIIAVVDSRRDFDSFVFNRLMRKS